jgi:hypothetical protein
MCLTCILPYFNTCDYKHNEDEPPKDPHLRYSRDHVLLHDLPPGLTLGTVIH